MRSGNQHASSIFSLFSSPLVSTGRWGWPSNAALDTLSLSFGCRRVDIDSFERNEAEVGWTIADSGLDPPLLRGTSKDGSQHVDSGEFALACVRHSLAATQLPQIDLYLLRWPGCGGLPPSDPRHASHRLAAWRGLVQA